MNTMNFIVLIAFVKGFIEKDVLLLNSYLLLENQILRSKFGKRVSLTDAERKKLALAGESIGPLNLSRIATIAKVETIRKWWRMLVKQKWNFSHRRKKIGRPPIMKYIRECIVSIAILNQSWGYKRIQGSLKDMGYNISHTTIKNRYPVQNIPETKTLVSKIIFISCVFLL